MTVVKPTMTMPMMELRETLRRFVWLVGMMAVISVVTFLLHQPMGRLIEQRQEVGGGVPMISALIAQR